MSFWWDLTQDRKIVEVGAKVAGARSQAQEAQERVEQLEARLEALQLANAAMWSFLKEQQGLSDAQLRARMQQIDLSDGRADGRMGRRVFDCPSCGHTMSSHYVACIYCGKKQDSGAPFPGV